MDKNENQVSICKKMEKWLILGLMKWKCKMKLERKKKDSTKLCPTLEIPQTLAHQALLSMGFSRQEYWSGLPCLPPGNLPNLGIKLFLLNRSKIPYPCGIREAKKVGYC